MGSLISSCTHIYSPKGLYQYIHQNISLSIPIRNNLNHKCRLPITNDRNSIYLSSVYMRVEGYMYFIRVMLSDQKRFRMLLSCKIRACWKSESLNDICFLRRRKTIINLWPLNHGTVEFYFYPWNKKVLTGIINLATILKQRTEIKFSQNL